MLERLLDIEVTGDETVIEEIELICHTTDFRRTPLVHQMDEGLFRSVGSWRPNNERRAM
jgi:hypothetical protein